MSNIYTKDEAKDDRHELRNEMQAFILRIVDELKDDFKTSREKMDSVHVISHQNKSQIDSVAQTVKDHMKREDETNDRIAKTLEKLSNNVDSKISWKIASTIGGLAIAVICGMFWLLYDLDTKIELRTEQHYQEVSKSIKDFQIQQAEYNGIMKSLNIIPE